MKAPVEAAGRAARGMRPGRFKGSLITWKDLMDMASKKIKIEGSKEKGVQGEGKSELLRVEVGGVRD